jgi:hypothetical protein
LTGIRDSWVSRCWGYYAVGKEEIKQNFTRVGWDIDGSFSEYLLIGSNDDGLSILAHPEVWDSDDPVFELIEHERNLTYGVQKIPTPQQAGELLKEHGQLPEEWDQP